VINAAREVLIATAGAAKAQTLARVIGGPLDPVAYPVQGVRPASGRLTWLVDRAAAGQLTFPERAAGAGPGASGS
jgi:6-phosphogluconolactonase